MSEGNSIISLIIKRDGDHVMSFSDEYKAIVQYFGSEEFASYAAGSEVDSELLRKITEGVTNHIRSSSDSALEWGRNAYAVCTNAKVGQVEGTNDNKAVFYLEIQTTKAEDHEQV